MDVLMYIVFGILAVVFLWGAIAPRKQWNSLARMSYRHPEPNEPSDSSYALTRVVCVVALVVLGVIVWMLIQGPPAT